MMKTIKNRTVFCSDNFDIIKNIADNSIDLIYLDPPFNKNKNFKTKNYDYGFVDKWSSEDIDISHIEYIKRNHPMLYNFLDILNAITVNKYYIMYLSIRLIEMERILKDSGSIYIHTEPSVNHYIKIVMDIIFGEKNFINEIVWCYKSGGASKKRFAKKHDNILLYSKSDNYYFNVIKEKSYHGINYNTGNKNVILYDDNDSLGKYSLVNTKDWWDIPMMATSSKNRIGYPTQKPIELLKKIIMSSSKENDIVLDPFAGSGTTAIASELLSRKWLVIDKSDKTLDIIKSMIEKEPLISNDIIEKITYLNSN